MTHELIQHVQKQFLRDCPEIKPGYTVRVHQRISEGGKERIQIFEGLVIKVNAGHGMDKTFTVRKVVSGIGVEKTFPFHSATIVKIEVVKIAKVRRAKLYYMRERSGKSARLKEKHVKISSDMKLISDIEAAEAEANAPKTEEKPAEVEAPEADASETKEETPKTEAKTEQKAEEPKSDEAETEEKDAA